ncbi:MAG: sel1 repeat family protein [Holosporales bacterium]|jgi:TPR repeat protein|nr:sel1 repeat family protein [Holosporales bacterium]
MLKKGLLISVCLVAQTTNLQGTLAQKIEDPSSLQNIEESEDKSNDNCKKLIEMGEQYEAENKLQQALACYQAAFTIDQESANPYIQAISQKINKERGAQIHNEEIEALLHGAERGNSEDAYRLGKIYVQTGNIENAVKMFERASLQKHPKAAYKLAVIYEKGELVPIDLAKAERYYKEGAINGHPDCAYIVSKLLEIEAQKNPLKSKEILEEAFQLKIDASNKGHSIAAAEVGYAYAAQNNHVKAKMYFLKAKKNATPGSTMTVNLLQIMRYNILAEDLKITSNWE